MLNVNRLCKLLEVLLMLYSKYLLSVYYECDTVLERMEECVAKRCGTFPLRPCFCR